MAENSKDVNVTGETAAPAAPAPPATGVQATAAAVTGKVNETLNVASEKVGEGLTKGKAAFAQLTEKYGMMIFVGILVALVLLFIAYMLYIYLSRRLTNKLFVELPDSIVPRKGTQVTKIDGGALPPSTNGNRATFLFWMYIHDIDLLSGEDLRHVFHRGDETTKGASPAVYLDGVKNRLYIRFAKDTDKTGNDFTTVGPTDLKEQIKRAKSATRDEEYTSILETQAITDTLDAIKIDLATHGVIVDYVPLQRWVHVAVVVNETVNRGYITTYLDGEVVSSISSNDRVTLSDASGGKNINVNFTGLNLSKKGDIYIGGESYNENMPKGFSGLVSRVTVSNFDMNGEEVRDIYLRGPVENLTSKLGLPAYGVRSPIYKIGA